MGKQMKKKVKPDKYAETAETCFLSVKKIKILHPKMWTKNELLQLATDISEGVDLEDQWDMTGVLFTTQNNLTTEWKE